MANPILTSGVRQNLLTLQQTRDQQSVIQNRLSTGKKVNSAIDNPVNYFTSLGLNDRSNALTGLLDGISNGIQTITAASQGIDAISKLVSSLQSTIKQAQADAAANRPSAIGGTSSGGTPPATLLGKIGGGIYTGNKSAKDLALDTTLGGTEAPASYNSTTGVTTDASLGLSAGNITLSIKAGNTTFVSTTLTATSTVRDVVNEINRSGIANASVDSSGKLNVTGTGSGTLQIGIAANATAATALANSQSDTLSQNTVLGLPLTTANTGIAASAGNSTVRTNLINQFNDLTKQIDQLAKDAGFNGKNLLSGDKLSIIFNEKTGSNQAKLDVQGETITAANLGILQAVSGTTVTGQFNIQDDNALNNMSDILTGALTSLRSTSSTLGSSLSVVQTRQDFTKNLANTLTTGADNLVSADSNAEGASLLALNTRQQLSQTALSLANQADQGVLRLFQ
ncbi:flagellin-like hook-associated protein FlgL [Bosea sp. BE125]|uniref:flagellin N-terminal helical domain-containing protein n=1 Tax=Bosea sp. BE125 TaxID=2817909 RepID=UPI00285ACA9B|nr:flagellin [Bosea sp. BE125]MDR6872859.1 flagellin-like hook-associated protein FlgL [Bosea sp. BE125]